MKTILVAAFLSMLIPGCTRPHSPQTISSGQAVAESVFLTRDHGDNPVVVWTERQNEKLTLLFATSSHDGKSISKPTILTLTSDVATHAESMPKVAFKKDGSIVAAYEKKNPTKENKYASAIYYMMSTDGGKSWSKESFLHSDTVAGKSRSYFDLEALPNGEIGASWLDIKLNAETGGRSVRFAQTTSSKGFSDEVLIDSSACQCCRIDVYTDKTENIFVAYRGLAKGPMGKQIRDMMIATSTDHGATFSTPVTISADNWNIDGCPHTGPSLCGNKAGLISLWYTEGTGTGIYYAEKSRTDANFSQRRLISSNGRHPQLTANEDHIAMLWEENIDYNGTPNTVIHYRLVKEGVDVENKALTRIEENAFLPVVIPTDSGFLIAYLMEKNDQVGVCLTSLN